MSEGAEARLIPGSRSCRALVIAQLVLAATLIGVALAMVFHARREDERRRSTQAALCELLSDLVNCRSVGETEGRPALILWRTAKSGYSDPPIWLAPRSSYDERQLVRDGWGRAVVYSRPGPIHKNGWDLISSGPNGVFEDGGGDDIVVGEDLPGGFAAISSESGTATQSK